MDVGSSGEIHLLTSLSITYKYFFITETSPHSTFPAFTLPLPFGKKLLDVVWMKPDRKEKILHYTEQQHSSSSADVGVV